MIKSTVEGERSKAPESALCPQWELAPREALPTPWGDSGSTPAPPRPRGEDDDAVGSASSRPQYVQCEKEPASFNAKASVTA